MCNLYLCILTDSTGLDLTSNSRFLCSFPGDVIVTALIDRQNDVMETNEMNNDASITGLSIDPTQCTGIRLFCVLQNLYFKLNSESKV